MAFAIWVSTRLWMGGVVSPKRDMDLLQALADKVRQMALCRPLLLAVDGLASYVSAFRDAFRSKFPRQVGEIGRCKMVSWPDIYIVQMVKQRVEGMLNVERRIVQGAKDMVESLIQKTQGKGVTPAPTAGNMILSDTRTNENEGIVWLAAGCEVDAHWCPEPEPQADPATRRHPSLSPPAKGEHATQNLF